MTVVPKYSLCLENIENINDKGKWILLMKSAYTKSVVAQAIWGLFCNSFATGKLSTSSIAQV